MSRAITGFLLEVLLMTSAAGDNFDRSESFPMAMLKFKGIHVCENHVARLHCGHSSATISIQTAKYGRDNNNICNGEDAQKPSCTPVDRKALIRKYCDYKSYCVVPVNSTTLGVVCPQVDKFLNVIYICVHKPTSPALETTTATPSTETPKENTKKTSTPGDFEDTHWVQVQLNPFDNHGNSIAQVGGFVLFITQVTAALLIALM